MPRVVASVQCGDEACGLRDVLLELVYDDVLDVAASVPIITRTMMYFRGYEFVDSRATRIAALRRSVEVYL